MCTINIKKRDIVYFSSSILDPFSHEYIFKGQIWKPLIYRGLCNDQSTFPQEFHNWGKANITVDILGE